MERDIEVIFAEDEVLFRLGKLRESVGSPPKAVLWETEEVLMRREFEEEKAREQLKLIEELEQVRRRELVQ